MAQADHAVWALGRGADIDAAVAAARRELACQGSALPAAVGLFTLVRSSVALQIQQVSNLIGDLVVELGEAVPKAWSWRLIEAPVVEVGLLAHLPANAPAGGNR